MSVCVQEAAERLDLDPGHVRRLVSQGLLGGRKVGGRWLVDEVAISDRLASRARPGRPLSPRSSWGLLWSADDRPTPWLAPRERSRARHRARTWPLDDWSWACRRRAAVHGLRAHPSMLQPLLDDARAVRSKASVRHLQVDLIAAGDVELYAREDDLPSLIAEYSLIPSQLPNVIMRVPPAELWLFDDVEAPWPVVAVDLLDARDDRSVRAANDLARRAGNPMIPIVPIEPLVLPRLGPHHVGLWTTLCDLADAHDSDRVVIGSQMVVLHALQARREPGRVSQDVDTVIDARIRPPALPAFLATLAELGFESAGVRPDEVAHRFKRATVHVDVLGPDGLGARADLRTTGTATTIQVRGGTQALRRSERVPVRHADRVALVPSRTCLAPS